MKWYLTVLTVVSLFVSVSALAQESPQSMLNEGKVAQADQALLRMSANADEEVAVEGLCGRAQLALSKKDTAKAGEYLDQAIGKLDQLKKKSGWRVIPLWMKADLARQAGDDDESLKLVQKAQEAIAGGARVEDDWKGMVLYLQSQVDQDNESAREAAEDAAKAFEKSGLYVEQGNALIRLMILELDRKKEKKAVKAYDAAMKAFGKAENSAYWEASCELQFALHLAKADMMDSAAKRYESAKERVVLANNPKDLKKLSNEIDALLPY